MATVPKTIIKQRSYAEEYDSNDPRTYIAEFGHDGPARGFGRGHDEIMPLMLNQLEAWLERTGGARPLKTVEYAALFGNSTMAYKYGCTWTDVERIWTTPDPLPSPRFDIEVVAVDKTVTRLKWGTERGLFAQAFGHDFNEPLIPTAVCQQMIDADLLVMMFCAAYIRRPLSFQRMVLQFLGNRTKPKLLMWTDSPPFMGNRNMSPEALFAGLPGWTTCLHHFFFHRYLTDAETAQRGDGAREFWQNLYVVQFEAMPELAVGAE